MGLTEMPDILKFLIEDSSVEFQWVLFIGASFGFIASFVFFLLCMQYLETYVVGKSSSLIINVALILLVLIGIAIGLASIFLSGLIVIRTHELGSGRYLVAIAIWGVGAIAGLKIKEKLKNPE